MARKRKIILKKSKDLTADEVLHILVARYVRLQNIKMPESKKVPVIQQNVFMSIAEYDKEMEDVRQIKNYNEAIEKNERRKKKLIQRVESQILSFLPKYKWFIVPVKNEKYAVGISTSDWGGGDSYFYIKSFDGNADALSKLKHQICH